MAKRFADKAAWITGGGSGIGRALAVELARMGADVVVSGRRADRLEAVAAEVRGLGRRGLAVPCDVTQESAVADAARRVAGELGRIDITVANAGWALSGRIEDLGADDWRRQLDVNVVGLAMTARHSLPYLRETEGRLGLVGSVAAFVPLAKNGAYVASKAAVRVIGETLAIELAGSGVSCTTMHPGFVESEIAQVDNSQVLHEERADRRPRQLMWTADDAARVMARALLRRRREFVFTQHGKLAAFLGRHAPGMLVGAQVMRRRPPSS